LKDVVELKIRTALIAIIVMVFGIMLTSVPQSFADNHAPEPPTGLKATSTANSITISWDENSESDLEGYYIYGKAKGTYGFIKLAGALTRETSYVDYTVQSGYTYTYYVVAVDDSGNESHQSEEIEAGLVVPANFSDIISNAWYSQYVNNMVSEKVVEGYEDGSFKPDRPVTRAEFAKMLVQAMKFEAVTQMAVTYTDLSGSHWAYSYINIAANTGLLNGYTDGSFKPEQNITREEIAKALAVAGKLAEGKSGLTDINSSWAKTYINSCVSSGIVLGYPDKTFRPKNLVTRAEATAMLARLLDR
jgi:hypothetical protein